MARSITTRSTNPKIMDDNIKILDDALVIASAPEAENVSYDNTDSGLTADDVQAAIDEVNEKIKSWTLITSDITSASDPVDVSDYNELYILPKAQGIGKNAPLYCPNFHTFTMANSYREGTTYSLDYSVAVSSDALTVAYNITGWTSVTFDIYGK